MGPTVVSVASKFHPKFGKLSGAWSVDCCHRALAGPAPKVAFLSTKYKIYNRIEKCRVVVWASHRTYRSCRVRYGGRTGIRTRNRVFHKSMLVLRVRVSTQHRYHRAVGCQWGRDAKHTELLSSDISGIQNS